VASLSLLGSLAQQNPPSLVVGHTAFPLTTTPCHLSFSSETDRSFFLISFRPLRPFVQLSPVLFMQTVCLGLRAQTITLPSPSSGTHAPFFPCVLLPCSPPARQPPPLTQVPQGRCYSPCCPSPSVFLYSSRTVFLFVFSLDGEFFTFPAKKLPYFYRSPNRRLQKQKPKFFRCYPFERHEQAYEQSRKRNLTLPS